MNRKGVYFSFDAIIASVIFVLTMISLFSYWYSVRETVMAEDFTITEEALRVSNLIFLPSNGGFGFSVSYEDKSLNMSNVEDYSTHTMDEIKAELSIPYNLSVVFEVYDLTSNPGHMRPDRDYEIGVSPTDDAQTISKVVRIAPTTDGEIAIVSVKVYG